MDDTSSDVIRRSEQLIEQERLRETQVVTTQFLQPLKSSVINSNAVLQSVSG
jgi:hypothetical protein